MTPKVSTEFSLRHQSTVVEYPNKRSKDYYYDLVTFKVQDTLFRVPRQAFERDSIVFRDMFLLPQRSGEQEGEDDENPILLPFVTVQDFEYLLEILYPRKAPFLLFDITPFLIPTEGWIAILRLSTMWEFTNARRLAIRKLKSIDACKKIQLSREYDIEEWVLPALAELARRDQLLTVEEGNILGMETVIKLGHVRESIKHEYSNRLRLRPRKIQTAETLVAKEFGLARNVRIKVCYRKMTLPWLESYDPDFE